MLPAAAVIKPAIGGVRTAWTLRVTDTCDSNVSEISRTAFGTGANAAVDVQSNH